MTKCKKKRNIHGCMNSFVKHYNTYEQELSWLMQCLQCSSELRLEGSTDRQVN